VKPDHSAEYVAPWYVDGQATIYNADALATLRAMPDESADLVLTDPPYNVGLDYADFPDKLSPDAYRDWCRSWFAECKRVSRGPVVLTPGMVSVPMWLADVERTHFILAWIKQNNCSRNYLGKTSGFQTWEPILQFGKSTKTLLRDSIDVPIVQQTDTGDHPCPKPLRLWRWLMSQYVDPGAVVLDPFMGSGTTLRAAKDIGCRAIGIEITTRYCEIAARRLGQEVLNLGGVA
jgi:site-specific DNA-methyltransferase (adenine-specific)